MSWACSYNGGNNECIQNFNGAISCKTSTWKIKTEMEEVAKNHVQWQTFVLQQ